MTNFSCSQFTSPGIQSDINPTSTTSKHPKRQQDISRQFENPTSTPSRAIFASGEAVIDLEHTIVVCLMYDDTVYRTHYMRTHVRVVRPGIMDVSCHRFGRACTLLCTFIYNIYKHSQGRAGLMTYRQNVYPSAVSCTISWIELNRRLSHSFYSIIYSVSIERTDIFGKCLLLFVFFFGQKIKFEGLLNSP